MSDTKSEKPYLLKADQIAAMSRVEKPHFLNPQAIRHTRALGDATGLRGLGVLLEEIAPGVETTEFHKHYGEDECLYVLSGTAQARIGDEVFDIGPGDFIGFRKGGLPHTIINTGAEPLVYLMIGQRLESEVIDYPEKNQRLVRAPGMAQSLAPLDAFSVNKPLAGGKS